MRAHHIRHRRTFRAAQTVPQFPLRIAIVAVLTIVASCVSRPAVQPQVMEVLDADTPKTTVEGNAFTAPAGWGFTVRGPATILQSPEGDSHIALVDVHATDADAAVAAAWAAYDANKKWPLKVATDSPDKDGWSNIRFYEYLTSPNDRRNVGVQTRHAGDVWNVMIYDFAQATGEKRIAQLVLISDHLFPKGYVRETFVGKTAHKVDQSRIAELSKFVETGMKGLGIPGVSLGLVQDGKVVFADGFGVRELDGRMKPDGDTLFMIASNTKALTTLMLAKLVDEQKLTWETPVTKLLPSFKLGSADTTNRVLVKHLVCACTGLPRQDLEWLFEFKGVTPDRAMETLANVQPTSKFGEMFQYSNLLALQGNHALPHAPDIDGKPAPALMEENYSVIPLRPAGGAWSNVRDMLKYVSMELAEGALSDGKRYIFRDTLLARRAAQVPIGKDMTYGMGLIVDTTYGVPVVHHGGDLIGFHSDMMWLPEQKVGAVILTNSNPGWILREHFRRKLLEVLFDGRPEADAEVASQAKSFFQQLAADRKLLTVPADSADATKLAPHYVNAALGDITIDRQSSTTVFDFGEFKSEMASRHNPDGSVSFITTVPGFNGFEFVVGSGANQTLIVRDAQHEYVFEAR